MFYPACHAVVLASIVGSGRRRRGERGHSALRGHSGRHLALGPVLPPNGARGRDPRHGYHERRVLWARDRNHEGLVLVLMRFPELSFITESGRQPPRSFHAW